MHNLTKFLSRFFIVFAFVFGAHIVPAVSATLPSGYTELEYIESTGTQYIDTGMTVGIIRKTEVVAQYTQIVTNSFVFGATNDMRYGWGTIYGKFMWNYGVWNTSDIDADLNKHRFGIDTITEKVWVDNNEFTPSDGYDGNTAYYSVGGGNIYLFARYNRSSAEGFAKLKVFGVKMWNENNILVQNLVPAQNSEGVVGMYDTVNNRFYTNSGTENFVAGPAVGIKIATTNYVTREFAPVQTLLTQTNTTITNTITQSNTNTASIATLAAQKQNRPNSDCPIYRSCLLVKDAGGNDRWYEIMDPFYNFFTPILETGTNAVNDGGANDGRYYKYDTNSCELAGGCSQPWLRQFSTTGGRYRVLNDNQWAVEWTGTEAENITPGIAYGEAKCATIKSVTGTNIATSEQLASSAWNTAPDANTISNYKYCWCKMTAIGYSDSIYPVSNRPWSYSTNEESGTDCAKHCVRSCSNRISDNNGMMRSVQFNGHE